MRNLFGDITEEAIERIKQFAPTNEKYIVAYSGGKDSIVALDLTKRSGVDFEAIYYLTTVDPPEQVKFVKATPGVKIIRPKYTMFQLILHKGFLPIRHIRYCCEYLKEGREANANLHNRTIITGVRWSESARRSRNPMVRFCQQSHQKIINPIIDWSDDEIWQYIRNNKLPYCSLYDEGFKRLGCIGCPLASREQRLKEFARWPKYEKAYKRIIAKILKPNETVEQLWNWWLEDTKRDDSDNCGLYT